MTTERIVEWWEETEVLPEPGKATMREHLETAHRMPATVLDAAEPASWAIWHRAEHKTRHPGGRPPHNVLHVGHLTHTHPAWLPAAARRAAA